MWERRKSVQYRSALGLYQPEVLAAPPLSLSRKSVIRLICFLVTSIMPQIWPAPRDRPWMNHTRDQYAYAVCPLVMATAHGWQILCPQRIEILWNGGPTRTKPRSRPAPSLTGPIQRPSPELPLLIPLIPPRQARLLHGNSQLPAHG